MQIKNSFNTVNTRIHNIYDLKLVFGFAFCSYTLKHINSVCAYNYYVLFFSKEFRFTNSRYFSIVVLYIRAYCYAYWTTALFERCKWYYCKWPMRRVKKLRTANETTPRPAPLIRKSFNCSWFLGAHLHHAKLADVKSRSGKRSAENLTGKIHSTIGKRSRQRHAPVRGKVISS